MDDWTLYVADQAGGLVGQIDVYQSLTLVARHNAVSTWELALPVASPAADLLLGTPQPRLVVRFRGRTVRSGPAGHIERDQAVDGDELTVTGFDDLVWLTRRVAHPSPAQADPPYNAKAYDTRTGDVAQVLAQYVDANAGPGAVAARQVAGLTCPVPAPLGTTVTLSARYQNLADFVFATAESVGLGVRITDLRLDVFAPVDSGAVFAVELGTLAETVSVTQAPAANFVYVAGQGTDAARTIVEVSDAGSLADWSRAETFQDRRDTNDVAQLTQAGRETLTSSIVDPSSTFQPLDTAAQQFARDWSVGDKVNVRVGDVFYWDVVREVTIRLDGGKPVETVARLGSTGELALFRASLNQSRRIRQLERS